MIGTGNFGPGDPWNAQLDEPAAMAAAIYPLMAVTTAVIAGVGVGVLGCLEADADPRLVRLSDVLGAYALWIVTSHGVRNNPRVRAVKDALVEMIQAAGHSSMATAQGNAVEREPSPVLLTEGPISETMAPCRGGA